MIILVVCPSGEDTYSLMKKSASERRPAPGRRIPRRTWAIVVAIGHHWFALIAAPRPGCGLILGRWRIMLNVDTTPPSHRDRREGLQKAAEMVIASLPVVGGALQIAFSDAMGRQLVARREEWLTELVLKQARAPARRVAARGYGGSEGWLGRFRSDRGVGGVPLAVRSTRFVAYVLVDGRGVSPPGVTGGVRVAWPVSGQSKRRRSMVVQAEKSRSRAGV
jgi:hypothetical protein